MTSQRQIKSAGTFLAAGARLAILAAVALAAGSCAPRYEYRAIPARPLSSYPGQAQAAGANVGAVAFYSGEQLTALFGFDLKKAGVIPVQVLIQNNGGSSVNVLDGARIEDSNGLLWDVLPSEVVYGRINDYTSGGIDAGQTARRTATWGVAGALLGAAVGAATGTNVGEALGKGAAIGAAAGAASSITGVGVDSPDTEQDVVADFSQRSLDGKSAAPGEEVSGFLYFPSESSQPRRLTLNLSIGGQRRSVTVNL
ncbi:MAG: hypothetical protein LBW85_12895 [Deltaproteobacteria bacterium]|jgi:hypothetical protein|nr:hypothetical protein [Deltaproteobacteria bacterium]